MTYNIANNLQGQCFSAVSYCRAIEKINLIKEHLFVKFRLVALSLLDYTDVDF